MFNRPSFGTQQNTGFGFGAPAANQSPFGQTSQLFGSPATSVAQTGGFGSAPSAFGATTAPVFGQQPNSSSGLFGTTQTPSFGATGTTAGGFGSTLFNQTTQPGSSGMFGATGTTSFGQAKSTGFGFGTAATAATNMFGASAQQQQQQQQAPQMTFNQQAGSSSLFGPPNAFNAGVAAAAATGTIIKFNPITGTDSMQKGGTSTMINTKHHCITCMKEYENKSLEELRFEDYSMNRKGPQQGQVFGGVPGQQAFGTGIASAGAPLFGTDNKPYQMTFGQQNTTTGTTGAFGSGMFGSTQPGTGAFNFNASGTTTGLFGSTAQQQQPSLFGQTQQQPQGANTSFGGSLFGQQQSAGLFGKGPTAGTAVGFNQQPAAGAVNTGFNFPNPSGTSLFGTPAKPPGATGAFGTNTMFPSSAASATPFGQPAAGAFGSTGAFGATGAFGKPTLFQPTATVAGTLGTQAGLTLGGGIGQQQSAQPFSYNMGVTSSTPSLFGQPATSGLNAGALQAKPLFGASGTTAQTGGSLFGQPNMFGGLQQPAAQMQQAQQSLWGGSSLIGGGLFGMGQQQNTGIGGGLFGSGAGLIGMMPTGGLGQPLMNPLQSALSTSGNTSLVNPVLEASLTADVFGYQPHLQGLDPKPADSDDAGASNMYRSVTTDAREVTRLLEDGLRSPVANTASSNKRLPIILPPRTKKDMLLWDDMSHSNEDKDKLNLNVTNNVRRLRLSEKTLTKEKLRRDDSFSSVKFDDLDSHKQLSPPITNRERPSILDKTDIMSIRLRNRSVNGAEKETPPTSTLIESPKSAKSRESGEPHKDITTTLPSSSPQEKGDDNTQTNKSPRSTQTIVAEINASPRKNPVKLTKDEYYTLPELDTLPDYVDENGKCIIRGFTIGRVGYGNVCFTDYMDVTGLDLDKHVHFRHKEIIVYPDDSDKPPLGQGLNRPAQVTLDNVFPRNNRGETIRDLRSLAAMRYGEKLRMLDPKYGIKSMDYRPETGSWVFTVTHFSKYGCTDSDDEIIVETLPSELKHRLDVGAQQSTSSAKQEQQGMRTPQRTDELISAGDLSKALSSAFSPIAKDKGETSELRAKVVKESFIVVDDSSDDTPSSESLDKTAVNDPTIINDREEEKRQASAVPSRRHVGLGGVAISSPLPPKRSLVAKDSTDTTETTDDFFDAEDVDEDDDVDVCDKCDQMHMDDDQCPGLFVLDTSTRRKRFVGMQRSLPMARGAFSQFGLNLFFDDLADSAPTIPSAVTAPVQQQQKSVLATRVKSVGRVSSKILYNTEVPMEHTTDEEPSKRINEGDQTMINRTLSIRPKVYTLVNKHRTFAGQLSRTAAPINGFPRLTLRLKSTIPSTVVVDCSAMFRRSYRVGWGRGFRMATILSPGSVDADNSEACNVVDIDMYSPQTIVIVDASQMGMEINNCRNNQQDPFGDYLGEFFEIMKSESESVAEEGNAPHYQIKPGYQALMRLVELAKTVSERQNKNLRARYYYHIWSLLKTLWAGGLDTIMAQRHRFNDWLEEVTADLTIQDITRHRCQYVRDRNNHIADEILILLAGHRIHDAAALAAQEGLSNLSLLLSQLNSSADTRSIITFQKAWWKHFGWDNMVPESIHKLYLIVSGIMFDEDKPTSINVVGKFDWLRTLGILFWYISDENKKFIHPIHVYTKIILEYDFIARPCSRFNPGSDYYDVLYYILVLSLNYINNIEEIITPGTHTDDPNDYRLSWLLMQSLCALRKGRISNASRYLVCVRLAAQLENADLIKWAVFVLMYIDDPHSRRDHIMAILYRNICVVDPRDQYQDAQCRDIDEQVVEMVQDFGVPAQWIHKIKAVRYGLLEMHWYEFRRLAKARKMVGWKPSQRVFLEKLAPSLILNNHFDALSTCLTNTFGEANADTGTDSSPYNTLMSQQENGKYGQISTGIAILKTFCRLRKFLNLGVNDQLTTLTTNNMNIRSDIHFLSENLHRYPVSTYKDCASLAQLAVSLNNLLYNRLMLPHLKDLFPVVRMLRNELPTLSIPPDYQMHINFQSFQGMT